MNELFAKWLTDFNNKVNAILKKKQFKTPSEEYEYFLYKNMVNEEPDFCLLYRVNERCHNYKNLCCRFCACPYFKIEDNLFKCKYHNTKHENAVLMDCENCIIPHIKTITLEHIKDEY